MGNRVRPDRYAHLRDSLRMHRIATAVVSEIPWCVACEQHQAPALGELCPLCEPDRSAPAAA